MINKHSSDSLRLVGGNTAKGQCTRHLLLSLYFKIYHWIAFRHAIFLNMRGMPVVDHVKVYQCIILIFFIAINSKWKFRFIYLFYLFITIFRTGSSLSA